MPPDVFFIDPVRGVQISYEELQCQATRLGAPPALHVFHDCPLLYASLLAAIENQATLILRNDPTQLGEVDPVAQPAAKAAVAPEFEPEINAAGFRVVASPVRRADDGMAARTADAPGQLEERAQNSGSHGSRELATSQPFLRDNGCRIGLYTSGTSGKPKLVLHALDTLTRNVRCGPKHRNDVWGLAYHPAHFAGVQVFFQAYANRNPLVQLFGMEPPRIHTAIEEFGISHLSATPTWLGMLAADKKMHADVKSVTLGGERTEPALLQLLREIFPKADFRNIYASTEVGSILTSHGELFHVPESNRGLVKIVDGELCVHRSLLADSLQTAITEEFYRTGDCVQVERDEPWTFRFVSRRSDMINVGGYKVNPHEVEALLTAMPEIQEAGVYGKANSVVGNLVCCDLVLKAGSHLTAQDVFARLVGKIATYKIPRIVRVLDSLPTTETGKRQRSQ